MAILFLMLWMFFPLNKEEWFDTDVDGIGDNSDLDRDGDGISNQFEKQLGTNDLDPASKPGDSDNDGIPDALDDDRDGDGYVNDKDAFADDSSEWSDMDADGRGDNSDLDIDGDRISNVFEIKLGFDPKDPSSVPSDIDSDGIPDALDDDKDGDNVVNSEDAFPNDANESTDMDGDGIGDNSDLDVDGDGISNEYELALEFNPDDARSTPADMDKDGIPDALDDDKDGDGRANALDLFANDGREWADLDGDGIGDNSDNDRDGDGYSNRAEISAGTKVADPSSFPDALKPVLENVRWHPIDSVNGRASAYELTGMAFDDGMGLDSIWLQDAAGNRWAGNFIYASHFKVTIPATDKAVNTNSLQAPLTLHVTDKAGNEQRLGVTLPQ